MTTEDLAALMLEELALIRQESREDITQLRSETRAGFGRSEDRFKDQSNRLRSLEKGQEQILERSAPLERAFDKDAVKLQDHEKRIKRLETTCLKG